VSVQHDRSPDDLRSGKLPSQRAGAPPGKPSDATETIPVTSGYPTDAETMVLPVFVTGKKPEPPGREAVEAKSVPDSERGMLVFVAALLGLGTIAVVTMMGFGLGGTSTKSNKPAPKPSVVRTSVAPVVPAPVRSSASPSTSPSRAAPTVRRSRTPSASPSPSPALLGTLTSADPDLYCSATDRSVAHPPDQNSATWFCRRNHQNFTPTAVCRWRFNDKTAFAVVGNLQNPSTWRCYT
jgi:hypothetical protein